MQFLSIDQVADILNLSAQGIRAEIDNGNLKAIQVGGRREWRIEESWLEDYVQRAEQAASERLRQKSHQAGLKR